MTADHANLENYPFASRIVPVQNPEHSIGNLRRIAQAIGATIRKVGDVRMPIPKGQNPVGTNNDLQSAIPDTREEDASPTSALQLRLAAGIVEKVIERNGGSAAGNVFWDEDALDSAEDVEEYVDPEFWDPEHETLPEEKEIEWNIYECN